MIMNKIILSLGVVLVFHTAGIAQLSPVGEALLGAPHAASSDEQIMLLGDSRLGFRIHVFSREDDLAKHWKAWVKKSLGSEGRKIDGFHQVGPGLHPVWSSDTLTLFYKTSRDGDFSNLLFALQRQKLFVTDSTDADLIRAVRGDVEKAIDEHYLHVYDGLISDLQKVVDSQQRDVGRVDKRQAKIKGDIVNHRKAAERAGDKGESAIRAVGKADDTIRSLESKKDQQVKDIGRSDKDLEALEAQIRSRQLEYEGYNKVGELNSKKAVRLEKELGKMRDNKAKLKTRRAKQADALSKTEKSISKAEGDKRKAERQRDEQMRARENHDRQRVRLEQDLRELDTTLKQEVKDVDTARENLEKMKNARSAFANRASQ